MSVKPNFGGKDLPFVFKGDKLVYPNPVKDGLVLWYDFAGMRNTDLNREIAKDLSDNGNDGTLQNFNYTAESGYDKNRLLFDGVDDKLQIPELSLDETGMTVGVNGKVYAYEDDKVISVGEDGEVVGGGRNYLIPEGIVSQPPIEGISWTYDESTKTFHTVIDNSQNRMYMNQSDFDARDMGVVTISGYLTIDGDPFNKSDYRVPDRGEVSGIGTLIKQTIDEETGYFTETYEDVISRYILLSANRITLPEGAEVSIRELKLEKGTVATPYSPAPEDFQTTTLSPSSLSNLQLYNRPFRKNELLQNAESEGLKELKEGVPVQDGLVLHYDFSNESNTSEYREKAFDYSGNGNHGELQNFNFTAESGYNENKLLFDGVDDRIKLKNTITHDDFTLQLIINTLDTGSNQAILGSRSGLFTEGGSKGIELRPITNGFVFTLDDGSTIKLSNFHMRVPSQKIKYISFVKKGGSLDFYENGEYISSESVEEIEPIEDNILIRIGSRGVGGYNSNIELNNFKYYNQPLTPEEIAHNYAIEKERFGIE